MKKYITKLIFVFLFISSIYFLPSCNDAGIINPVEDKTLWEKSYGGVNSDVMTSMNLTGDGGSIITGYTISSSLGDNDVYAMKLDAKGDITWSNIFGSSSNDQSNSIVQTPDGGYIIAGQTNSFGATNFDIYVIKLGSAGNVEWSNIYKAPNDDYAVGIVLAPEGSYTVCGYSNSFGSPGNNDIFLMKIGQVGNVEWAKSYGGIENDFATYIQRTTNGYVVCGYTFSFTSTNDVFIMNFNANGTIIWSRIYSGFGDDRAFCIEPSGNDFLVSGYSQSFGLSSEDMFILKLDNNGFLYNNIDGKPRTFGDSALQSDRAYSIIPAGDGTFLIAGYMSTAPNSQHTVLMKLYGNCEFAWAKRYEGTNNNAGYNLKKLGNRYIIAGNSFSTGSNDIYYLSVKDDGSSCGASTNFTPLGGNPEVLEGPVTVIINDVTSTFQKTDVQSSTGGTGFSTVTVCTSQ